ncbi:MAG: site-specific integrase [Pseudobdellovibrionaceae bacterium]
MLSYRNSGLCGLSVHTIRSYRDTIKLLLKQISEIKKCKIQAVSLDELTAENVKIFLGSIEKQRENSVPTRNQRLAVIKRLCFFAHSRYCSRQSARKNLAHPDNVVPKIQTKGEV